MVMLAPIHRQPVWPLPTEPKKVATYGGKAFGAKRRTGDRERHHVGVDLPAQRGAPVVAMAPGRLIATQGFNGPNAVAILEQTDEGPVILYGEVAPDSWSKLGLSVGSRVEAGQHIADVGVNPGGSTMLHLEMYTKGTKRNARWYADEPTPSNLYDPTEYLATAARGPVDLVPSDEDDHDHDDEPTPVDPPDPGVLIPDVEPEPPLVADNDVFPTDDTPPSFPDFFPDPPKTVTPPTTTPPKTKPPVAPIVPPIFDHPTTPPVVDETPDPSGAQLAAFVIGLMLLS